MRKEVLELAVLALARIMCAYIHSQNGFAILAQARFSVVAEQAEGTLPPEAPTALGSSLDSFQHVEAVMKEDDVSTLGLDSQDWEMVSDMVADTENAVTDFMQGTHVVLEEPKVDLQSSFKAMEETMANLKLGPAARGVGPPSKPKGVVSAAAAGGVEALQARGCGFCGGGQW